MSETVRIQHPTTLQEAILKVVRSAGKKPDDVYAVFDNAHAIASRTRPHSELQEFVILFRDWTFLKVDASGMVNPAGGGNG